VWSDAVKAGSDQFIPARCEWRPCAFALLCRKRNNQSWVVEAVATVIVRREFPKPDTQLLRYLDQSCVVFNWQMHRSVAKRLHDLTSQDPRSRVLGLRHCYPHLSSQALQDQRELTDITESIRLARGKESTQVTVHQQHGHYHCSSPSWGQDTIDSISWQQTGRSANGRKRHCLLRKQAATTQVQHRLRSRHISGREH
jgi:hypothetical protein